jgi:hypothetical protein
VLAYAMRMPESIHSRRRTFLGVAIIVFAVMVSTYLAVVIASEGLGSAVRPIVLAILLGVSLARLWVWSARHWA